MRHTILLLLLTLAAPSLFGADDHVITITSVADVEARRQSIINFIWGTPSLPTGRPSVINPIPNPLDCSITRPYCGPLENLHHVELFRFNQNHKHSTRAFLFVPNQQNGQVVIVHQGHASTMRGTALSTDAEDRTSGGGLRRTINALLIEGYTVVGVYMPHVWEAIYVSATETDPADNYLSCECNHDTMFHDGLTTSGNALRWFLDPTIMSINELQTRQPAYTAYHMLGLSGGGWATTVVAAIDPRIRMSFPVAGSIPTYLRGVGSYGDEEQKLNEVYSPMGYPDLYVLGSYGAGRKQVQVLNRRDQCCFGESLGSVEEPKRPPQHNLPTVADWNPAVREYERNVRNTLATLRGANGANGSFRLEIDEAAQDHLISWNTVIGIILPELNGGRRSVGAASQAATYLRSSDTHGLEITTVNGYGLPPYVVGVPAVVENADGTKDLFHRDNANVLTKTSWTAATGWTSTTLQMPSSLAANLISDPAALARNGGGWDVVAVANDYNVYHWSSSSSAPQLVAAGEYARGTPVLIRSGSTQLDVIYRSDARGVKDSRWNGTAWTTTDLGGSIADFPTAVVAPNGTIRVYVRGVSGILWEASQAVGSGTWQWGNVSAAVAGAPAVTGSPAAAVSSSGAVTVWARNPADNLVSFTLSGNWTYANRSGGVSGSPTATPDGAYVRGTGGAVWLFTTQWISRAHWSE
jgi:hypothetical protein